MPLWSFYDPGLEFVELLDQRQKILAVGNAGNVLEQRPMPLASILFRPFGELLGHEEWVVGDGHHTLTLCRLLGHEHGHRKVFEHDTLHNSDERRVGTECVSTCGSRWSR